MAFPVFYAFEQTIIGIQWWKHYGNKNMFSNFLLPISFLTKNELLDFFKPHKISACLTHEVITLLKIGSVLDLTGNSGIDYIWLVIPRND